MTEEENQKFINRQLQSFEAMCKRGVPPEDAAKSLGGFMDSRSFADLDSAVRQAEETVSALRNPQ